MRTRFCRVASMAVLLVAGTGSYADEKVSAPNASAIFELARIAEERAVYVQDFENEKTVVPMQLWYKAPSGNRGRLISQGVDPSVSFGGSKASYRVEVLFESERQKEYGSIYLRFPVSLPVWSDMKLQWRIKTESDPGTRLGYRHGFSSGVAGGTNGYCTYGVKVEGADQDGWELWQASIVCGKVNPAEYISGVSLYIEVPAATRGVIHIDNIRIVGRLQSGWEDEWKKTWEYYTVYAERDQRADAKKRLTDLRFWSRALGKRQAALREPSGASAMLLAQYREAAERVAGPLAAAGPLVKAVENGLKSSERFSANVHAAELKLMDARYWLDVAESCAPYVKDQKDASIITYTVDLTQSYEVLPSGPKAQAYSGWDEVAGYYENPAILPDTKPVPARAGTKLENFGARGVYVPYSFAVSTQTRIENLTFATGELSAGGEALGGTIDLRVVAPVYMPVRAGVEPRLRNVMLVHDPDFVRAVGKAETYNAFKNTQMPEDAATMQPITIEAGQTRQFYLLVKAPADAKAGTYEGTISGNAAGGTALTLDVKLEVLPFDLEPTPFSYGAFYESFPADEDTVRKLGVGFKRKTFEQIEQDLLSQGEHGFNTLNLRGASVGSRPTEEDRVPYKGEEDSWRDFDRILDAAVQAGLTRSPFVWVSHPVRFATAITYGSPERKDLPQNTEEMVAWIEAFVPALMARCEEKGYPSPALFGADEVTGERLMGMKPGYEAVRNAGGLMTIACCSDFFGILGPDLVLPMLLFGARDAETERIVRAVQAKGREVWIYNCPASNVYGAPASMRRRYGLGMWRNGENGMHNWAFDDFDGGYANLALRERPVYCYAFPTWSGRPIDTITYEALREGIYDTRYMATLEKALARARQANADSALVAEVGKWLENLSVNEDLQKVRRKMADFIIRLHKAETRGVK